MEAIQIFNNPQFGQVRVAEVNGEPMFCLADVCSSLDIQNVSRVANDMLDDDLRKTYPISDSLGREQQATFVVESGLYLLIMRSNKPEAKQFRKWVTSEVLPSIRKHGAYMTERTLEQALLNPDYLIQLATKLKEEQQRNKELEAVNKIQAPKALFADAVTTSNKSILVGELAKILRQNGYEVGERRLFDWMRKNDYLCSRGERYNQPTQRAMEMGLFEIKKTAITKPNGDVLTTTTTKVAPKGQMYFVNKFLGV